MEIITPRAPEKSSLLAERTGELPRAYTDETTRHLLEPALRAVTDEMLASLEKLLTTQFSVPPHATRYVSMFYSFDSQHANPHLVPTEKLRAYHYAEALRFVGGESRLHELLTAHNLVSVEASKLVTVQHQLFVESGVARSHLGQWKSVDCAAGELLKLLPRARLFYGAALHGSVDAAKQWSRSELFVPKQQLPLSTRDVVATANTLGIPDVSAYLADLANG
jgi:hypothetical protein